MASRHQRIATLMRVCARRSSSSASTPLSSSAQPENPLLEVSKKQPSRIRAVFFGFLVGVTASGGVAYGMLTEDIERSAAQLNKSVEALGSQVTKMASALEKVETLEQQLQALRTKVATRAEVDALINQVQDHKDELAMTLSQHKAAVWEAQDEMFKAVTRLEKLHNQPPQEA
eukprot:m.95291 g.95291  ORF g.95291 m.95291 type:complete len:173 (+) comp14761_c0_seq3:158-676(+)